MKIVVAYKLPEEGFKALLEKGHELIYPKEGYFSSEELMELMPQTEVLISCFTRPVNREMITLARNLKMIANYGVGYNTIDVAAATEHGIVVTNTPDPVIEPTAELALALMLAISRKITTLDKAIRVPDGLKWGIMENLGVSLVGKTLGIIGMGNIGQSLARRALACGMKIQYHNRKPLDTTIAERYQANYLSMKDLLTSSDYISLNAPYTPETHHLINRDALRLMKSTAYLINTARGPLVDEAALAEALSMGTIAGAGLDVFENEPEIHAGLLEQANVVMVPHVGTGTIDTRIALAECVAGNILKFIAGDHSIDIVNPDVLSDN